MRLQAIKLAGFKSFVEPTTVAFPSNLCAVVGPNGCGKSNIIDAVRWVMGESSAKTLRGDSMADVIFNGTSTRQPVGQAGIELLFDNAEGRLTGEYAAYSEISVRREVTRDGQSNFYLNGHRCRRKDITDLFLGTGIGHRGYSIIEQGMISDLIEARPEDLRGYLEEAAGISKYKERRRETERRISHTKDNLDRLSDLREELGRNLQRLERQAKGAERYTALKKEERRYEAELHALKWQALATGVKGQDDELNRLTLNRDAKESDQRRIDAEVEAKRAALNQLSDELEKVQRRYYDQGTEIARVEETIQFQNERHAQYNTDLEQVNTDLAQVSANLEEDGRQLARLGEELEEAGPKQEQMLSAEQSSTRQLASAEQAMAAWQQGWDEFNTKAAETRRKGEVQQSRIEHLEQALDRANTRVVGLEDDIHRLSQDSTEQELAPLKEMLQAQEQQIERIEQELTELNDHIEAQRVENAGLSTSLDEARSQLQSLKGRHASLEALQQAALGQQDDAEVQWLEGHGLGSQQRLAERLQVSEGWDVAVETVLGSHLQAVCVDGLDAVASLLGDFSKGHLNFIATQEAPPDTAAADLLAAKVSGDAAVTDLLQGIHIAESLPAAMKMSGSLGPGESVVTQDGIWLGKSWLRINKDRDAEAGVIKRQEDLVRLAEDLANQETHVTDLGTQLEAGMAALKHAEEEREAGQARLAQQQRSSGETRTQLAAKELQAEQVSNELERARAEVADSRSQMESDNETLTAAREELQLAEDQMQGDAHKRAELIGERDNLNEQLTTARAKAKTDTDAAHQLALTVQSLQSKVASTQEAVQRLQEQKASLVARKEQLEQTISEAQGPRGALQAELHTRLEERLGVEQELADVRLRSQTLEGEVRDLEQSRTAITGEIETLRSSTETVRLDKQGLEVRRTTIEERLAAEGQELADVIAALDEDATEEAWEEKLAKVAKRISRLGAINLAAIDEFKVQAERKEYLDAQNEDLEKALATLEGAIRKIDVETRTRFKETFDKVNDKLQLLFPRLFGGGQAYLEMTGEDLLDTGVSIMARPPGKRNTHIHLLSGGEKALTAIALVFSIFNLNPAPFCMLDEVDAPLDDANVGRYSALVKEMSASVQFIYITHNKLAMEMAEQLMGVTMQEPGVSRLVTVDVDEAIAMAAV